MPRRSSAGRPAPRSAPCPTPVRNPLQPATHAPPPAPVQNGGGSMLGGIGASIADGMAFGTGSAVARRAVDAMLGPRTIQHETVVTQASNPSPAPTATSGSLSAECGSHVKAFQDCVNANTSDISKCQFYLDMLYESHRSSYTLQA